jgi:dGTPase
MRPYGGFEHNLQSLRVVDELEERYAAFRGLNLTFECREGILKHCSARVAQELGAIGERFLKHHQPGLEAQIANLADEIAYNNHDVDDGIRAGLVDVRQLCEMKLFRRQYEAVMREHPDLGERLLVHEIIRRMINHIVVDLIHTSQARIDAVRPDSIEAVRLHGEPLIALGESTLDEHRELMRFLRERLYRHYRVLRMTAKAQRVVKDLFGAFMAEARLMPPEDQAAAAHAETVRGTAGRARVVADYIAGMTDRYAILEHQRVFDPSERT